MTLSHVPAGSRRHARSPARLSAALGTLTLTLMLSLPSAPSTAQEAHDPSHDHAPLDQARQPADPSGRAEPGERADHGEHREQHEHDGHEDHGHQGHANHVDRLEHSEHAEHTDTPPWALPPPTPEERAAAFPDLGDKDIHQIEHDDPFLTFVLFDQLEIGDRDQGSVLHWDLKAWAGRDLRKLWVRSRGGRHDGATEHAELEVLWGRALGPWWDWVAGVRHDFRPGPSRTWAALGIQGLAPYWFELDGTLYLGEGGRAAARLEAEYELLMTNRLIFQPVFKLEWHSRDDLERGVGSGLGSAEAGLRLRYEIRREVAPYLGVVRERRFGGSADLARAAGLPARDTWLVAGVRLWF